MSILASLVRAYERLPDRPPFGYSREEIGFVVSLDASGAVVNITDLRQSAGKRMRGQSMLVPMSFKRPGIKPRPFFLWDNANFALGVGNLNDPSDDRFDAFKRQHLSIVEDGADEGLTAFRRFLEQWRPEQIEGFVSPKDIEAAKVVFALEPERRTRFLHERPHAEQLWARCAEAWMAIEGKRTIEAICLVTGEHAPIARTHPPIRGIPSKSGKDADSIVSFNLDAFNSYGHVQGDNAPVGERTAFAYTTALNRFLERGGGHRLQIGDAATVFWADSSDFIAAALAELYFHEMIDPRAPSTEETEAATAEARELERSTDKTATSQIHDKLRRLGQGETLDEIEPALAESVRFHVLGLAPNAARLSVRFYFEDDFGVLAENYRSYLQDIALEPWPNPARAPSLRRFERRTAPAMRDRNGAAKFDAEGVSPLLAGELLRSVLTGARFPTSLLTLLLLRIRSDQLIDATRIALVKAIIVRAMRLDGRLPKRTDGTEMEDYLMRSDPDDPDPARRLGRLFAIIERAQRSALGDEINATVADKFLAAASATPGQVMPNLIRNARDHHIKRLRNGHSDARWIKDAKHARAMAGSLDRDIGRLVALFDKGFPKQLSVESQGLFLVGYYQERWGKSGDATDDADLDVSNDADEE